ncbi:MAG: DUF3164 family protein, partial [Pseudomonadota bacterium]|nr:DUF3164 family protein [Pseudomonadota bacterium]
MNTRVICGRSTPPTAYPAESARVSGRGRPHWKAAASWALAGMLVSAPALAVDADSLFEQVTDQARTLAEAPYEAPESTLPDAVAEMGYDRYRQIRYRDEQALWRDHGNFQVELFHPGFLYDQPVDIHLLEDGEVRTLPFEQQRFRYDDDAAELAELDLSDQGYAGFRLHYPLNRADVDDEFAVFLGASYFRLVGRNQGYGLSARGLAIDTAMPQGEEFPSFREFWLVQPEADANRMTVLALLDQEHGVKMGGAKGNVTLTTFDGTQKVQLAIADQITFGPELQSAKKLVDECLVEWSTDSRPELQAIVQRAFNTDKEGLVNRAELFGLLRLEIADDRWQRAMKAIKESIRVEGTKEYVRFYQRPHA